MGTVDTKSVEKAIEAYRHLCRQVDNQIARLVAVHGRNLVCQPGCYHCCVNLTVFTVELYAIAIQLAESGASRMNWNPRASCGWLEDGLCRIYAFRPIICRTHGLAVAVPKEDGSEGMEVSFCPLNFAHINPEAYGFGPDNSLDLADLNEKLCRLNADFIEAVQLQGWNLPVRIELARLSELLDLLKG